MDLMKTTPTTPSSILILFQAKSEHGLHTVDRLKQEWKLYHLAERFNADHDTVRSLCGAVHYVNWGSESVIITPEDIQKMKAARKGSGHLCEKCIRVAIILRDIEEENQKRR